MVRALQTFLQFLSSSVSRPTAMQSVHPFPRIPLCINTPIAYRSNFFVDSASHPSVSKGADKRMYKCVQQTLIVLCAVQARNIRQSIPKFASLP